MSEERTIARMMALPLARLDLKARFIVDGFLQGLHRSPLHGFSSEFSDYRDYVPGDDPSDIDWKVYARTDKYYIKRYRAETNLRCTIVVDSSASMHYASRSGAMTKIEYATALAASLGHLMIRQQDRVGLMVIDSKVRRYVPPRSKRSHLAAVLEQLLRMEPAPRTDLAAAIESAAPLLKRRGLVIVFSDLLDDPERVTKQLRHLRHGGHDLIVFHVLDPAEVEFPFEGLNVFEDPETGRAYSADAEIVRKSYLASMDKLIAAYTSQSRAHGFDYNLVNTGTPFENVLRRFLMYRRRRH